MGFILTKNKEIRCKYYDYIQLAILNIPLLYHHEEVKD